MISQFFRGDVWGRPPSSARNEVQPISSTSSEDVNQVRSWRRLRYLNEPNFRNHADLREYTGRNDLKAKVISPTGNRVGLFTDNQFWIFDTSHCKRYSVPLNRPKLLYKGLFEQRNKYSYGLETTMSQTYTFDKVRFLCAAQSDDCVAVGIPGYILVFKSAGACYCAYSLPRAGNSRTSVSHLLFSPEGTSLVALVQTPADFRQRVLIASVSKFPTTYRTNITICEWDYNDSFRRAADLGIYHEPNRLAFSHDKDESRIVVSTNCTSNGMCEIWLLCKNGTTQWRVFKKEHRINPGGSVTGVLTGIGL
jgi:hypothetical protein